MSNRKTKEMPKSLSMVEAQIQVIEKDIEESHRYRLKLLKRIQPLEDELKGFEGYVNEDSHSVTSNSERAIGSTQRTGRGRKNVYKQDGTPPHLSEAMDYVFEQNCVLEAFNNMYAGKLEILKSSFYDKETLEHSLQKYLASDCIEYKEFGLEAYEILSLHQKILEITFEEKRLMQQLELKDNLTRMPLLHAEICRRETEVNEMNQILNRQKQVYY